MSETKLKTLTERKEHFHFESLKPEKELRREQGGSGLRRRVWKKLTGAEEPQEEITMRVEVLEKHLEQPEENH